MPLVECKNGYTETYIGGTQYQFNRDRHGRYVTGIENPGHLHCFLAREEMYGVVPDIPESSEAAPQGGTEQRKPRVRKAKEDGKEDGNAAPPAPGLAVDAASEDDGDTAQQDQKA